MMIIAPTALLLLGLAGSAGAQNVSVSASAIAKAQVGVKPSQEITIGAKGNVKLSGTIASIASTTVSVNSWGGVWTIDASNAKFTRKAGGVSSLAEMKAGDRVTISGTMQTTGLAVTARMIHNNSLHAIVSNKVGTVSNVNASSGTFTLTTKEGTILQVTTGADTKFWLGKATSTFSALVGLSATSTVRVDGVMNRDAGTVLASKVVISLSSPLKTAVKADMRKEIKREVKADIKNKLELRLDR